MSHLQGRNAAAKFIQEDVHKGDALDLHLAQLLASLLEDANVVVSQFAMQSLQVMLERFPVPPSLRYRTVHYSPEFLCIHFCGRYGEEGGGRVALPWA